ncbi:MAG: DUF5615 family PIN-like protein [Candidatus Rokubacteria bacterium]|nr:DUF5615 family PIN-like protein [Candidatus Rokubacteria bacterium]MBI3107687.1 DUF5615 family PIN-like protein [Candidatus Rokubacteria bacterium]
MGLARAADHEILEVARREGRVVVTADLDDPLDRVLGYAARLDLDHQTPGSRRSRSSKVSILRPGSVRLS